MCTGLEPLLVGTAAAGETAATAGLIGAGGAVTGGGIMTALSALSGVKSLLSGAGGSGMPTVAQTSPVADDAKAKADAEAAGIQDRNSRLKLARSASLLSGSAQGDLSTANVAQAGSTSKQTLGA